jgi:ATP-dependent Clp protease, protease subunit
MVLGVDLGQLLDQRIIVLSGVIKDSTANAVIAQLLYLQHQAPREWVYLLVDSPGGAVSAGLAILDTIDSVTSPVETRCIGQAGGMAGLIVAAGRKGHRFAVKTARLSAGSVTDPDHPDGTRRLARVAQLLASRLCRYTGQPEDVVRDALESGCELDAQTAQVFGLVDVVEG